jgi:hypothetical protein
MPPNIIWVIESKDKTNRISSTHEKNRGKKGKIKFVHGN